LTTTWHSTVVMTCPVNQLWAVFFGDVGTVAAAAAAIVVVGVVTIGMVFGTTQNGHVHIHCHVRIISLKTTIDVGSSIIRCWYSRSSIRSSSSLNGIGRNVSVVIRCTCIMIRSLHRGSVTSLRRPVTVVLQANVFGAAAAVGTVVAPRIIIIVRRRRYRYDETAGRVYIGTAPRNTASPHRRSTMTTPYGEFSDSSPRSNNNAACGGGRRHGGNGAEDKKEELGANGSFHLFIMGPSWSVVSLPMLPGLEKWKFCCLSDEVQYTQLKCIRCPCKVRTGLLMQSSKGLV
jgi:hypothetical protein